MNLKPFKFYPILKEKIWGGQKLQTLLNKDIGSLTNAGESWELSSVDENISIVADGEFKGQLFSDVIEKLGANLLGKHVYRNFGTKFPLLIKFIDANDNLSIQVHPDEKLAASRNLGSGKTEMWYVIEADSDAQLISGFCQPISSNQYKSLLDNGQFIEKLALHDVKHGDVFFIPAGRIHAIGRGVMVAEIQQTSDITFRVFDYNRLDSKGKTRQLHIEEAKEALNFSDINPKRIDYNIIENQRVDVVQCPYFETGIIEVNGTINRDYSSLDSCVILICVGGKASVDNESFAFGETLLIPASLKNIEISGHAELLEVFIP